jgi:hypothetical protein
MAIKAEEQVVRQLYEIVSHSYQSVNEESRRASKLACTAVVEETLNRPQPRW